MNDKRISIRVTTKEDKAIRDAAKKENRNVSNFIVNTLRKALNLKAGE